MLPGERKSDEKNAGVLIKEACGIEDNVISRNSESKLHIEDVITERGMSYKSDLKALQTDSKDKKSCSTLVQYIEN